MISKYVNVGDRIDIESIRREGDAATEKIYQSKIERYK